LRIPLNQTVICDMMSVDADLRSGRRLETARRSESIIYTDNILYLVLHFYYTKPQAIKMRDTMYNRLFN
jgi:hypothetical protein